MLGIDGIDISQLSNPGSIYEQAAEDIFSGADGCSVTVPRAASLDRSRLYEVPCALRVPTYMGLNGDSTITKSGRWRN